MTTSVEQRVYEDSRAVKSRLRGVCTLVQDFFGEIQSKAMRAYAQSGQYHTIVEIHDS